MFTDLKHEVQLLILTVDKTTLHVTASSRIEFHYKKETSGIITNNKVSTADTKT